MFFTSTADAASRFGFDENEHHGCTPEQMRLQDELGDIPNEVLQQIYDMHIKKAEYEIEQLQEQKREKVTQLKSNNSKIHRAVFPEHQLLQLPVRIDQLPREGEQAVNINTKVMKLKKVHLLSLCEDRSRQKTIPCSH